MAARRGVDDAALLHRFEPVLRLTLGELFLPSDVEGYLPHVTLVHGAGGSEQVLAQPGTVDLDRLAVLGWEHRGAKLSLRYVSEPMGAREYRAWRRGGGPVPFRRSNAAAAAGVIARVVAAVMRLSLLLRGKVPGGHTAAAYEQAQMAEAAATCHYYGHVVRDGGYVVLQYWFFYPMNDWRSSFGGVNDHEADWEHVSVILTDQGADATPAWVAFASHDERGADLRRRWDDPDLDRVGQHPVVYVGAGSHSAAYLPGDYLVTVSPDLPPWLQRLRARTARIMPWFDPESVGIGIPFIDYRRGDGLSIGPGQEREWVAHLIDDSTAWVAHYSGLWGLDTGDPLGGERAPAGPRYERDGTVRQSWAEPVAWTELDGEPATRQEAAQLWQQRPVRLAQELDDVQSKLATARDALRMATVADRAAARSPLRPSRQRQELQSRVTALRARQADLNATLERPADSCRRVPAQPGPQAHLRHRALPLEQDRLARSRALRVWASGSGAVIFAALGALLIFGGPRLLQPVAIIVMGVLVVEAALRRHLVALVINLALTAVAITAVWAIVRLILGNLRLGVGVLLLAAAAYMGALTLTDALVNRQPRT
jgi:hypothetical protein